MADVLNTTYDTDDAFIREFGPDVQDEYDKTQSFLRPTVRERSGVTGYSTRFQKVGGAAVPQPWETRNRSEVPMVEITHDYVDCPITDRVIGIPVSKFDQLKTNIDERAAVRRQIVYGGRQSEDQVIASAINDGAIAADQRIDKSSSGSLDQGAYQALFSLFGSKDVPDDGERWGVLSHNAWNDLLSIEQVAMKDWIREEELPFSGNRIPMVLNHYGFKNMAVPHLPTNSDGSVRYSFFYHRTAVGYAIQQEFNVISGFNIAKHTNQFNSEVADGAVAIDTTSIVRLDLKETAGEGAIVSIS